MTDHEVCYSLYLQLVTNDWYSHNNIIMPFYAINFVPALMVQDINSDNNIMAKFSVHVTATCMLCVCFYFPLATCHLVILNACKKHYAQECFIETMSTPDFQLHCILGFNCFQIRPRFGYNVRSNEEHYILARPQKAS